ncbi:metallophosphoesterase [Virgibacillus alimentarius]|uniref:MPP superfamily phosphohydrolase n=1 Tax=Virgibacillus alimentarius TaxID=698769 RepID=A0ABS4S7R9_9BACI|nr:MULTISPECIES: metallophosphoesterase [Virgibacillus]MBP2256939.1 putative MPP superfamily phosphohydrolase [Virgibacillus alimentarius]HLR68071.1 metallophosphoesterase [Virgibacillus sp.]
MNRRTFLKKAFGSFLAFIGLSGGTYYYAREIEPSLLDVHKKTITSSNLSKSFNDFKIVQFSDTHIGFHYTLEQFNELVEKINKLNPNLIVFTGDLVDEPNNFHNKGELTEALKKLTCTHGKYWIYGNHDHGGYGTNKMKKIMDQADFHLLKNEHARIEESNDQFILGGIDDVMLGSPNLKQTLRKANPDLFTVILAHEPDYADTTRKFPVDIQLSGHSHGGQVRFPFLGHLYTPLYAEKYVQGEYQFTNERLTLYVNRGIGTTRLPYRFLCKPEIHEYTLQSSK